jgi:hypothetical protein
MQIRLGQLTLEPNIINLGFLNITSTEDNKLKFQVATEGWMEPITYTYTLSPNT